MCRRYYHTATDIIYLFSWYSGNIENSNKQTKQIAINFLFPIVKIERTFINIFSFSLFYPQL